MSGKIYFVSGPGRIKIGFTTQPETRLKQLRYVDMEPLEVIAIVDGSGRIEKRLQDMARPFLLRGEWFRDCPEVREIIDGYVSGRLVFDKFGGDIESPPVDDEPPPRECVVARKSVPRAAIEEASAICDEITRRLARGESVSDLVRSACFLAEHVIAPSLGLWVDQ